MADKVTTMAIKVDLQCYRCYRKIKRVLCCFPEIRNQVYDEKQNLVLISVVSCCPERILKKICSKGGKSVEKAEIITAIGGTKKEPEKKKEDTPDKAKDDKKKDEPEKKKDAGDKPKDDKKKDEPTEKKKEGGDKGKDDKKKDEPEKKQAKGDEPKKKPEAADNTAAKEPAKKEGGDKPKDIKEPAEKKAPAEKKVQFMPMENMAVPVAGYPSIFPPVYPVQGYYDPYQQHQGYASSGVHMHCHCSQCHGMPVPYMAQDASRGNYHGIRYDYLSEENPGCAIM